MLGPSDLPFVVPFGAGSEVVDDDDPSLLRCPFIIQGSPSEIQDIHRKFWEYRIWYKLTETNTHPEVMPEVNNSNLVEGIRSLCQYNEDDSGFLDGVDSVTLIYTKFHERQVIKQLADLPDRMPLVEGSSLPRARKSIHIQARSGIKSLAIFEQCFDMKVPDPTIFLFLNNPSNPSWVVRTPRDRPPVMFRDQHQKQVLDEHAVSERAAWEKVKLWLHSLGIDAHGEPYPNGNNEFPDYRAWVKGVEYNVEMTAVPDMGKWTLRSNYRDLEARIREMAKQPSETRDEVVDAVSRVLKNKSELVRKSVGRTAQLRTVLVVSNWSSYELANDPCWAEQDVSRFAAIILIEFDKVLHICGCRF